MKCSRYTSCRAATCRHIRRYVIYALVDIRIGHGSIFSIGISTCPRVRFSQHIKKVRRLLRGGYELRRGKDRIIASLLADDLLPACVVLDEVQSDCQGEVKEIEAAVTRAAVLEGCPIVGLAPYPFEDHNTDGRYGYTDSSVWDIDEHVRCMADLRDIYRYG